MPTCLLYIFAEVILKGYEKGNHIVGPSCRGE